MKSMRVSIQTEDAVQAKPALQSTSDKRGHGQKTQQLLQEENGAFKTEMPSNDLYLQELSENWALGKVLRKQIC